MPQPAGPERPLRILILEDVAADALLMREELRRQFGGVSVCCAADEREFEKALAEFGPDAVLSDYTLPQYDAMAALRHVREKSPALPFVIVTGSIDEETAVECMKAGASDYVLKTNLIRLGPAVEGALARSRALAEKAEALRALRASEERYALAARGVNDGLWDWNLLSNRVYYSPRWKAMLGYREHEIGDSPDEWLSRVHAADVGLLRADIESHLRTGSPTHFQNEHRVLHRDGEYRFMLSRGLAVRDQSGTAYRMAGSQTDITRRKRAEERLVHDALHDALTNLPNRVLFLDRLQQDLARSRRRPDYTFAVLFLDVDRFKVVNDSLGHSVGDRLLIAIARRLEASLRPGDTVARLGGDEFAILLDDIKDSGEACRVADRIQRELRAPFLVNDREFFSSASVGVAMGSAAYERPEDILRDADTAMYRAKAQGRGKREVFHSAMHTRAVAILELETDLHRALEREEFKIHYQPIVSFEDGRAIGFEALVRWLHPERGLLLPAEFVPAAEETGLIVPIGEWVFAEACRQLREWRAHQPSREPMMLSINLSARQFGHPHLVRRVQDIVSASGLPPGNIRLEITESMIMDDGPAAVVRLSELKELGVRLDIDDFGTGYSSLSYLSRFPIDALKIDRSFVGGMHENPEDLEIVRTIVTLASNLKLHAIAEGVETKEQMARLRDLQCDFGQGYYFAMPAELTSESSAGVL